MLHKIILNGRSFSVLLLALILSLYGAWMVNAKLGYGYDWLYGFYDTEQHIAYYAPQNRFRGGFELTSVGVHKKVFQEIVASVHANGEGLADISYYYAGKKISLLHHAEIVHLKDVASLINALHMLAAVCLALLVICMVSEYRYRIKGSPNGQASIKGLLSVCLMLVALVLMVFVVFGAKAIFYQMHILIFPEDHQWFFYYQDSLMSTLMKAPDLFAGIAVQIVFVGILLYAVMLLALKRIVKTVP
jgi:hypothetical protein